MHKDALELHRENYCRIQAVLGNEFAPVPDTPENRSRDRLLRTQAGLFHILTEVIPQTDSAELRQEVYLWISAVYDIVRAERCDAEKSTSVQEIAHG